MRHINFFDDDGRRVIATTVDGNYVTLCQEFPDEADNFREKDRIRVLEVLRLPGGQDQPQSEVTVSIRYVESNCDGCEADGISDSQKVFYRQETYRLCASVDDVLAACEKSRAKSPTASEIAAPIVADSLEVVVRNAVGTMKKFFARSLGLG